MSSEMAGDRGGQGAGGEEEGRGSGHREPAIPESTY